MKAVTVFPVKPWTPEKISGMFIVSWPISCEMKPQKITDKPQNGLITGCLENSDLENSDPRPEKLRPLGVSKTQTPKKLRPWGVSKTQTRKTQTLGCLENSDLENSDPRVSRKLRPEKLRPSGCLENSDPKNKTYLHRVNAASRLVYCSWHYHNSS